MKQISFTNLSVENFCSHKNLSTPLGKKVFIKGCNGIGKSTLKLAIFYALNTRDENGKEITGIRPHDENGKDYEVDTTVQLGISVDGSETTLGKVFRRNFNKKGDFTGNVTDYSISDIPKRLKDYDEYIKEIIPSEICINAQAFLSLDTAHRRALLEQTFSTHTTDSIIDDNPEFEPIRELLKVGTIDELKKRCRLALNGDKNKKGLRDLLAEIPVRIDEVEKTRVDIDLAELELLKNSLLEQIAENKAKQESTDKQFEEYDKLQKGILELQFALSDLERNANEKSENKRRELRDKEYDLCRKGDKAKSDIGYKKTQIHNCERYIEDLTKDLEELREEYTRKMKMEFDESNLICSMCGQPYPEEKANEIRTDFNNRKKDILRNITVRGNLMKSDLETEKQRLKESKEELQTLETSLEEIKSELEKVREKMKGTPETIDISDTPEYKAIKAQIEEKETAMHKGNSADEIRRALKCEYENLHEQLREVEKQLASANNDEVDRRIEELHREQREIAQKIADQEKELDYIVRFERTKNRILEEDVNGNFEYVKFSLFELMVNGDYKDICSPVIAGESYDRNLNHGAKILAEIDICRAFQRANDICCAIMVDDAESIDSDRIPEVGNQLVIFQRTDDKELRIESEG